MTVRIRGIGAVGGFGCGAQALARGEGEPGILAVPWQGGTREIPAFRADAAPLERFVPKRALRRIDGYSRMAMLAACLALEDAGLEPRGQEGLGLVLASAHGATATTFDLIDSMIQDGDACSSPIHFAGSLHNTPASHVGILLGATGPSLTLSRFGDIALPALELARLWIEEGRCERVLAGVADELSELMGHLHLRSGSAGIPGEGAVFFLLSGEAGVPALCTLDEALALPRGEVAALGGMPGAEAFRVAAAALRGAVYGNNRG
jgi:3-oxoacyl-[acyl-carrier-protein] synthase II